MYTVRITKSEFIDEEDNKIEDLNFYLNSTVEIEEPITLENLFDILFQYQGVNEMFKPWTLGIDLYQFYDEMKTKEGTTELDYLEVSKNFQCWKLDDGDELEEMYDFIGKMNESDISYALDFTPINNIKDLEVRINDTSIIYGSDNQVLVETKRHFCLYDFLGTIFYEITFHGNITGRESKLEDLERTVERIDKGEEKLYSMEEVKEEIDRNKLQKLLDKAIEEENYEEAAEIKKKMDENGNG